MYPHRLMLLKTPVMQIKFFHFGSLKSYTFVVTMKQNVVATSSEYLYNGNVVSFGKLTLFDCKLEKKERNTVNPNEIFFLQLFLLMLK